MTNVLKVPAFEFRAPVSLVVSFKELDSLFHLDVDKLQFVEVIYTKF
jgi:hypothetical protein